MQTQEWTAEFSAVEALISTGRIFSGYDGFSVHDGESCHEFPDILELPEDGGVIRDPELPPSREEILKYDVNEIWVQRYIKANGKKFGLSRISKSRKLGPDFRCSFNSKRVFVEAEVRCRDWFYHGHEAWGTNYPVAMLIALHPSVPSAAAREKLPKVVRYIDQQDFIRWIEQNFWRDELSLDRDQARRRYLANRLYKQFLLERKLTDENKLPTGSEYQSEWFRYSLTLRGFDANIATHREMFVRAAIKLLPRNQSTGYACLTDFNPRKLPGIFHKLIRFVVRRSSRYGVMKQEPTGPSTRD